MSYVRGLVASAAGVLVMSPDAVLLRFVENASTGTTLFYRTLFTGLALAAILSMRRGGFPWRRLDRANLLSAGLMAIATICFVAAVTRTPVANVLVLAATMPMWGAVLGWVIIGEKPRPHTWAAIALAFGGIVAVFSGSLAPGTWTGNLLALACAGAHGLNLVVLRKAWAKDSTASLCLAGFIAAALTFPFATPLAVTAHDFGLLALQGLIIVPLAFSLFIGGTRYVPAAEVAFLMLVEAVLGTAWAWWLLQEVPEPAALAGGAAVVFAGILNAALSVRKPAATAVYPRSITGGSWYDKKHDDGNAARYGNTTRVRRVSQARLQPGPWKRRPSLGRRGP